ncbi:MAG TPA: LamB/YcsF family protein, partial [Candidatus Acidoferrum sp.]|nr:LamB/YcsF family protein [Candidatus Acidoferrum sp.]
QALRIAQDGALAAHDGTRVRLRADTICIHGDTPGAPQIAAAVAETLRRAGVALGSARPASRKNESGG